MNILHIVDKLSKGDATMHGVTRLLSWWVPRFDPIRYKVGVCSLRSRESGGIYLENRGIRTSYVGSGKYDVSLLPNLLGVVNREKIDILHLHGYAAWTVGRLAAKWQSRLAVVVHEHMVDENIPGYQRILDRILSMKNAKGIAISESVKNFMVSARGMPEDRVEIIENGIPLESFRYCAENPAGILTARTWRKKLAIPDHYKIIGTVGRLDPVKGHIYLLEATREILKQYPSMVLLVVGDGMLRTGLEKKAEALGIANHVRFLGYQEDVAPLLAILDVMVISSLAEGGPLTLVEAMASHCAIVATDTIGLKTLIRDGESGYLVPPKNAKAIATRVLSLLRNSDLCREMAREAAATSQVLDIGKTVRLIESFYNRMKAA